MFTYTSKNIKTTLLFMNEKDTLLEKLAFLRYEHAKTADAMQKFSITKSIEETENRLKQIENEPNQSSQQTNSISNVKQFKEELNQDLENVDLRICFEKISNCSFVYDKAQFNRLKKEFLHGNTGFEFAERVGLFVSTIKE